VKNPGSRRCAGKKRQVEVDFKVRPKGLWAIRMVRESLEPGAVALGNGPLPTVTFGNGGLLSAALQRKQYEPRGAVNLQVRDAEGRTSNNIVFTLRPAPTALRLPE
jgi:hypothetical protein